MLPHEAKCRLKEAEGIVLKSLREQHALDMHLDALALFFLATNGLFLVSLLQVPTLASCNYRIL